MPFQKLRLYPRLSDMNGVSKLMNFLPQIEKTLGYHFQSPELLVEAFVHRSYLNEQNDAPHHNERLEFLGDVVLGLIVSDYLYHHLPQQQEGELSSLRAKIVNSHACVAYLQKLDLYSFLLLGKGERSNDGRGRESLMADLFEALMGAIYLDGGLVAAKKFMMTHFADNLQSALQGSSANSKGTLQDLCQKLFQAPPQYTVVEESGPDHNKHFEVAVLVEGHELGRGKGSSKKAAQHAAAEAALARGFDHIPLKPKGNHG